jgi:hypothetical protein
MVMLTRRKHPSAAIEFCVTNVLIQQNNSKSFAPLTPQMMPHLRGPKRAPLTMTEGISYAGINKAVR